MSLRLAELQKCNLKAQKFEKNLAKSRKDMEAIDHYQSLLYIPGIIFFKIINYYHDYLFATDFEIKKTRELISDKYF